MKKFKSIIAMTLALVLVLGITASATVIISDDKVTKDTKYEYPITPEKTPDIWKTFSTHQQMLDACEIPKKTLDAMSTKTLLLASLDYPLAGDALCYDDTVTGFEIVMENSNALSQLFLRDDFSYELASLFETTTAEKFERDSSKSELKTQLLKMITEYALDNNLVSAKDKARIINSLDNFTQGLPDGSFSLKINTDMNR